MLATSTFHHLGFGKRGDLDLPSWQAAVRDRLLALLGSDNAPSPPEHEVVNVAVQEIDGLVATRRSVRPGPWPEQPVYELVHPGAAPNGVTLIVLHGHGDDLHGPLYDYIWALPRRGYRVVMPILFGKMERQTRSMPYDPRAVCDAWSLEADSLGVHLAGIRLFDARLAYRVALGLPGVDAERVCSIGLSMGGELSLYLAAVEPGIAACVSAGFFANFESLLLNLRNCACYSIPGWPQHFDVSDIAGCVAPRPLLLQKGDDDPCFDHDAVLSAVELARTVYAAAGRPEHLEFAGYPGGHVLHTDQAVTWLRRHVRHDEEGAA